MYPFIMDEINELVETKNVPYDFLMEIAEEKKKELIKLGKIEAKYFGIEYEQDDWSIQDEIHEIVYEEAYKYAGEMEYQEDLKKEREKHD